MGWNVQFRSTGRGRDTNQRIRYKPTNICSFVADLWIRIPSPAHGLEWFDITSWHKEEVCRADIEPLETTPITGDFGRFSAV